MLSEKPSVLVIEEHEGMRAQLKAEFQILTTHWSISFAATAADALSAIEQGREFTLVVLDIALESMSPVDVFKAIKDAHPHTIRFGLTDRADDLRISQTASIVHQFVYSPCESHTLRMQVTRALALRERLNSFELRSKLHEINALPPLPALYAEVMTEIHSADASIARIAEIISKDVSMTAKLLQIVNSAGVGLRHEIDNIAQATSLLGLERVSAMILMVEVFNLVSDKPLPQGFSAEALWDHSLKVGEYAKVIATAQTTDSRSIEAAFTSGLLHDLGLIILTTHFGEEMLRALAIAQEEDISLLDAELDVLGATHAGVGGYLLELWGLPDPIVEAITFHDYPSHLPQEDYRLDSSHLEFAPVIPVHVANYFCEDAQRAQYGCAESTLDHVYLESTGLIACVEEWWELCTKE